MPRSDSGFTLIEVLIATTIAALLLTAVYGTFSALSRSQQRLRQQAESCYLSRVLFDRLGRELRTALYRSEVDGMVFLGATHDTETTLTLCTTSGTRDAGVVRVQYALRPNRDATYRLLRSETPLLQQDDADHWVKLTGEIRQLRLRFGDGDDWRSTWSAADRGRLPDMLEITLELGDGPHPDVFRTAFEVAPMEAQ